MNNFSNETLGELISASEAEENLENWQSATSHYQTALKLAPLEAEL